MNKIDCIREIGDTITLVDVARGSLSPGTPRRKRLDEARSALNDRQLQLADLLFAEGSSEYQGATAQLKTVNTSVKALIAEVNKVAETFAALTKLVNAIDDLLMLATGVG